MKNQRRTLISGISSLLLCKQVLFNQMAHAESDIFKLIVSTPPGGGMDTLARLIAKVCSKNDILNLTVENVPGANGIVALNRLLSPGKSEFSLALFTSSSLTYLPELNSDKSKVDPKKFLTPLNIISRQQYLLIASKDVNIKNFITGKGNVISDNIIEFGVAGIYGLTHFTAHALQRLTRQNFNMIPYKGMAEISSAFMSDQIQMAIVDELTAQKLDSFEKINIIATLSADHSILFPKVPLFKDYKLGDLNIDAWFAIYATGQLSNDNASKISSKIMQLKEIPEFMDGLKRIGMHANLLAGDDARNYYNREVSKTLKFIRDNKAFVGV